MIPPIASNFVAGETPEAALAHVESLNDRGRGRHSEPPRRALRGTAPADADADAYVDLVESIADRGSTPASP